MRHELLDRTIVWNERQLRSLLQQYVTHYNQPRPHRSLGQRAPAQSYVDQVEPPVTIQRHTTCGGLINGDQLVVPYGFSDYGIGIARVSLPELLEELRLGQSSLGRNDEPRAGPG